MKIDGSQTAASLLQRMQEAHEAPEARGVSKGEARSFSLEAARGPEGPGRVEATEPSPLESRLRATAEKALRGEFSSDAAVREAVVEDVLRDRWEAKVGRSKVSKMIRKLKPTLVDDPEFTRQVDDMLIMAARYVDRSR